MTFTHVLISRPADEAAELAHRVLALGLQPVLLPAFRFRGLDATPAADRAWTQAVHRLAIFTSPRAVGFGLPRLAPGMLDGALVAAIGPATGLALQQAGVAVDLLPGERPDSEALLASTQLPARPGAALIFAAPGGRPALREGLAARGWQVREALVYERLPLSPDPAAQQVLERAGKVLSVWTSGTALRHLLQNLSPAARDKVLEGLVLVPSARLQALARELGAARVAVCGGADNASLERGLLVALGRGPS